MRGADHQLYLQQPFTSCARNRCIFPQHPSAPRYPRVISILKKAVPPSLPCAIFPYARRTSSTIVRSLWQRNFFPFFPSATRNKQTGTGNPTGIKRAANASKGPTDEPDAGYNDSMMRFTASPTPESAARAVRYRRNPERTYGACHPVIEMSGTTLKLRRNRRASSKSPDDFEIAGQRHKQLVTKLLERDFLRSCD